MLLGPTWFLYGIWIQKLKRKYTFLTGSYPVFHKAVVDLKIVKPN